MNLMCMCMYVYSFVAHMQVVFLTDVTKDHALHKAIQYNLSSAACCSVLLMEDNIPFTHLELFTAIAGLSYRGLCSRQA